MPASFYGECSCGLWMYAPAVVAAREVAEQARAEWNATSPPFGLIGELNTEQQALHRRMEETDRDYVVARDMELSAIPTKRKS